MINLLFNYPQVICYVLLPMKLAKEEHVCEEQGPLVMEILRLPHVMLPIINAFVELRELKRQDVL